MESLSVELGSPSPSSFDVNLVSLIEAPDDHTSIHELSLQGRQSSLCSPNILGSPSFGVPIFPPFEDLEKVSDELLPLSNLQQPFSSQLLTSVENPFGDHLNQLPQTDLHPQLPSPNHDALAIYGLNERNEVPIDLVALVHAALQKSDAMECPAEVTPIPRVLQSVRPPPPSLNLKAIITPRHVFASPFAHSFSRPFSTTSSLKRRYYGSASSSRYCHICGRGASSAATAKCSNSRDGTCRKIICEKCMLIHDPLNAQVRDRNPNTWICTHCRMKCPACARCHQYAKNNMKRRLKTQAGGDKRSKKGSSETSKVHLTGTAPIDDCDMGETVWNLEKKSNTSNEENVSSLVPKDLF